MTPDLSATERRINALRSVKAGRVRYDAGNASWLVNGVATSGWNWRTFSEMRTAGWIQPVSASGVSAVVVTEAGERILPPEQT